MKSCPESKETPAMEAKSHAKPFLKKAVAMKSAAKAPKFGKSSMKGKA